MCVGGGIVFLPSQVPTALSVKENWLNDTSQKAQKGKNLSRQISIESFFVQRLMSFILVITTLVSFCYLVLCRRYVSFDKSEQFQPLFDLGGSFISCNTHSAESCSRDRSMFEFQLGHSIKMYNWQKKTLIFCQNHTHFR